MPVQIITQVTAVVAAERAAEVVGGFEELLHQALPEGLLRTELLAGPDGQWQITSLWRDRAALDAMRASPEPPAAPALFRRLGADPQLSVLEVRGTTAS